MRSLFGAKSITKLDLMNNKLEHRQSQEVWFTAPNQVEVRKTELRKPGPTEGPSFCYLLSH